MMVSVYFAVGICSARAIKNPIRPASFLWFIRNSDVLLLASSNQGLEWLRETGVDVSYSPHPPLFALIWRLGFVVTVVTVRSKVSLSFVDFRK